MALIKCPDCGKEISDKTEKCLHCGCPINPVIITRERTDLNTHTSTDVNSKIVVQSKEGCFLQTLNVGCVIVAIIIILILIGGLKVCS
jgi:uncharacterized membrane protein YvbJ